jgi:predicted SAM-dependent methyltransferase|tara:strand:- start:1058 stop:1600 length:543 start_codon:yes stop_codon:yes gene_type:complete
MIKINMGCGWRNFGDDWIHIDGGDYEHLDSKSITKLEIKDNTVDLIYASHIIEYFDREAVNVLLQEWKRTMKNGGTLRIAVPNFEIISNLYVNKKINLNQAIGPLYGKMLMSGNTIYHKTTYDFESLKSVLESNGFVDVRLYDWRKTEHSHFDDHSQAYIPHMDKENGTLISLNVECKKS